MISTSILAVDPPLNGTVDKTGVTNPVNHQHFEWGQLFSGWSLVIWAIIGFVVLRIVWRMVRRYLWSMMVRRVVIATAVAIYVGGFPAVLGISGYTGDAPKCQELSHTSLSVTNIPGKAICGIRSLWHENTDLDDQSQELG